MIGKNREKVKTVMGEYIKIPAMVLRGGTSKGIYLMTNDLPEDPTIRDQVILNIYGSPDIRQINGLGGADPLTSKVALIAPSTRPNIDVDYTFGYVGIKDAVIDYDGNCGNISAGVGPFAILDVYEAITLFTKAGQLGYNNAYLTLGNIYREGSQVPQDFKKAKEYYKKGIDQGDDRCWVELSEIFVEEEHFENWEKCWNHYFQSKFYKENFCDEWTLDGSDNSSYGFKYVNWLSFWYRNKKKIKRDELLEWLSPIKNQMKSDNKFKEEIISSFEAVYAQKPQTIDGINLMASEIIQKQNKFHKAYWEWILEVLK